MTFRSARRTFPLTRGVAVAVVVALALGCGTSDSDGPAGGSGGSGGEVLSEASFCRQQAEIFCGILSPCCDTAAVPLESERCIEVFMSDECPSDEESPYSVFEPALAAECLTMFADYFQDCTYVGYDSPVYRAAREACVDVWRGTSPNGGPCVTRRDCEPADGDWSCVFDDPGDSEGGCVLRPHVQPGEPCDAHTSCLGFCEARLCMEAKPAGATCGTIRGECASGGCEDGVCMPYRRLIDANVCEDYD